MDVINTDGRSILNNEDETRGTSTVVQFLQNRRALRNRQPGDENCRTMLPVLRERTAAWNARTKYSNIRVALKIPPAVPCSFMTAVAEALSEVPPDVCDIDAKTDDLKYDKNYAKEIMAYLKELEIKRKLPDSYLEGSSRSTFSAATRSILIDWLIQVQHYLKLHQETLYLTTNIFDHFIMKNDTVATEKLQLLLLSSLLIASKLHERFSPELKVLQHLADDTYTKESIMKMEQIILTTLKFELVMPDPMVFLHRCLQAASHEDVQLEHLSTFFMDVVLPEAKIVKILPSKFVAAAHCLARKVLFKGKSYWNRTLDHYSGYTKESVSSEMLMIANAVMEAPKSPNQGAVKKYASKSRYRALSELPILKPEAMQSLITEWDDTE